jgi:hypothetical protein
MPQVTAMTAALSACHAGDSSVWVARPTCKAAVSGSSPLADGSTVTRSSCMTHPGVDRSTPHSPMGCPRLCFGRKTPYGDRATGVRCRDRCRLQRRRILASYSVEV